MPIRASALNEGGEEKEVSIKFGDDTLNIVYRVDMLTPKSEERVMELANAQRTGGALAEALSHVVARWDLLTDDGKPYPLTVEALSELPILILNTIFEAINAAQRPNRKSGKR